MDWLSKMCGMSGMRCEQTGGLLHLQKTCLEFAAYGILSTCSFFFGDRNGTLALVRMRVN